MVPTKSTRPRKTKVTTANGATSTTTSATTTTTSAGAGSWRASSRKRTVSVASATVGRAKRVKAGESAEEEEQEVEVEQEEEQSPAKVKTKANTRTATTKMAVRAAVKKTAKAAATAAVTVARTKGAKMLVGAHVSAAGGPQTAVGRANEIGANCFGLFLKSQRRWANGPLTEGVRAEFVAGCGAHGFDTGGQVVPHGSYLVNLANTDPAKAAQAYDSFVDDLSRCARLGIGLYNIHPGSAVGAGGDRAAAMRQIGEQLNRAFAEERTGRVVALLETMAAVPGGTTIGGGFEDLAEIMGHVRDQERVGVCLDTCHVFAAGYDLRSPAAYAATMDRLEAVVGPGRVRAVHVNDSKAPLGSGRDVHANIGTGYLGLGAFWNLMNDERLAGLPLILETPAGRPAGVVAATEEGEPAGWAAEIKLLEGLVGMDPASDEFGELAARLAAEGEGERERIGAQVKQRAEKEEKAKAKATAKGKGKVKVKAKAKGEEEEEE